MKKIFSSNNENKEDYEYSKEIQLISAIALFIVGILCILLGNDNDKLLGFFFCLFGFYDILISIFILD